MTEHKYKVRKPTNFLHWELGETPKSYFPTHKLMPFSFVERDKLGSVMSIKEILGTNDFEEDGMARRQRKWREVLHTWSVISRPEYGRGSIENAMWFYGTRGITVHHFTMAVLNEFRFAKDTQMDAHLRWLYWSFDGGREDEADWREILATFNLFRFHTLVKTKPINLITTIFDIFARGGIDANSLPNDTWYINSYSDILKIFSTPCLSNTEVEMMREGVASWLEHFQVNLRERDKGRLRAGWTNVITRRAFKKMLHVDPSEGTARNKDGEALVTRFVNFTWQRLPAEQRLLAFDTLQMESIKKAEMIAYRYQLRKAMEQYSRSIYRKVLKEWRIVAGSEAFVRRFQQQKYVRKRRSYLRFWYKLSCSKMVRRRRNILASAMGCYIIKARTFARIKIFNYTERKISIWVAKWDSNVKLLRQGCYHIRNFQVMHKQRLCIAHWYKVAIEERNEEKAMEFLFSLRTLKIMQKWGAWAKEEARIKRQEFVVADNQRRLAIMMTEAENTAKALVEVEETKAKREEEEAKQKRLVEREAARERAKKRVQDMRNADKKLLLSMQRDARRKRVKRDGKRLRNEWKSHWKSHELVVLDAARQRTSEYLESKDSEMMMELRARNLKKEFYAPPKPETAKKEEIMSNARNIALLYLEAKLKEEKITVAQAVAKFDKEGRGFLTYEEFRKMMRSIGVSLSPIQVRVCFILVQSFLFI
jgi:hypothetical protein